VCFLCRKGQRTLTNLGEQYKFPIQLPPMASVVKYPSSRFFVASFYDARGRLRRKTTRETDRKRALRVAEQFERVAKAQGSPQRIRRAFGDFYREHFGEDLPFTTPREYCKRWLGARRGETSSGTLIRYQEVVDRLLDFLGTDADRSLEEISKTRLLAFRDAQLAIRSPTTTNFYLKVIRRIFRDARRDNLLFLDPAESIAAVRDRSERVRRPFTVSELRALLAVANDEWQSLIKFGLYTAQRLGDLAALTWSQIDLERSEIRFQVRKTGKSLLVPVAHPLHEHLLGIAGDNPRAPLHPHAFEVLAKDGVVGRLSHEFSDLLMAAGLRPPPDAPTERTGPFSGRRTASSLSFHSLRHTAVSLLKDAGVPDSVVWAIAGHESAAMSQRYTHVGTDAMRRATESLPEI
jgi:integrase